MPPSRCETPLPPWARSRPGSASTPVTCWPRGATQGESLVVGDAVNIAARLEQAAAPGTVLVGEATWALVAHAAHGHQVEPLAAKGKSEPLAAWLLESVDPLAPGHRRRLDLPMVGRATELGLVRLTATRTAQLRRPHLVTMLGQPGIGKSRLVVGAAARRGGNHAGRALPGNRVSLAAGAAGGSRPRGHPGRALHRAGGGRTDAGRSRGRLGHRLPGRRRQRRNRRPVVGGVAPGGCDGKRGPGRDPVRGRALGRRCPARRDRAAGRPSQTTVAARGLHGPARVRRPPHRVGRRCQHAVVRAGTPGRRGDAPPARSAPARVCRPTTPIAWSPPRRAIRCLPSTWPR